MEELPIPISREDKLLHNIIDGTPNIDDLIPISREEIYLKYLATHQITGGIVGIDQGGTGGSTAEQARENLEVFKAYILYDNSNGTNGTITLSDDSSNYNYLEVFYSGDGGTITSARVPNPYENGFALVTSNYHKPTEVMHLKCAYININENLITWNSDTIGMMWVKNQELPNVLEENAMLIYQVLGFKY